MPEEDEDLLRMIERFTAEEEKTPAPPFIPVQPAAKTAFSALDLAADDFWARESQDADALPPLDVTTVAERAKPATAPQTFQNRQKRRVKKKHRVRRFFAASLVIVLLLGMSAYAIVYHTAQQTNYVPPSAAASGSQSTELLASNALVTNILLIGADGNAGDSSRSDTMLMLSIDRARSKIKLTSFLRDSWVELPSGKYSKLNAACSSGGAALVAETIEKNFKVRVNHYALVNFDSFEYVIDALAGINVPVTDKEADFLCKKTRLGKQIGRKSFSDQMENNGTVHFNGEQALIYCRIRALDDDFHRTQRQRKVMSKILEQIKGASPLQWIKIANGVLPNIETDMSASTVANLAMLLPVYLNYEVLQHRVPEDGTWENATKSGAAVLVMDIAENADLLKEFIYE
ncbi:MAG: LCP family protein [Oscillospiraceae bacterium]|jgi:LCP family protein required for cell wall assembly|nr:LCP family protein [Oscillospiraceae bacterium]